MNTRTKVKRSRTVKVLYSGEAFTSSEYFQSGILPTKRQVLERILSLSNFRTKEAAKIIAEEVHQRWLWCNVYPVHVLTITKKIQDTVSEFSKLDRWPKKKRQNLNFSLKVATFLQDIDKLFDVFCYNEKRRRYLERKHNLRMSSDDYIFYEDQKAGRKARCLDEVAPLSPADKLFSRRVHPKQEKVDSSSSSDELEHLPFDDDDSDLTLSSCPNLEVEEPSTSNQNRHNWKNLARMCDRYQLSDRAGAAVATSVLQDLGLVTADNQALVIDHQKLRRERERCREELRMIEQGNVSFVGGLYLDGRKDGTRKVIEGPNGKYYRSIQTEDHYTLVGEPGNYYLTHLTPANGTGRALAEEVYKFILNNEMVEELKLVGTDSTASMTGRFKGFILILEQLLQKPLQWVICLLHTNELPLRHVFTHLDGKTTSPETFNGPIGKILNGSVSEWPVMRFKSLPNPNFPDISQAVVEDLSTDQKYAYRICRAVLSGSADYDLQILEVRPLVHSRWLTLGCRILRRYVSFDTPSDNLRCLAEFCIAVYFPTWFGIKLKSDVVYGSMNYFDLVQRIIQLPNKEIQEIAIENVKKNSYFAHPENVLLSMLGDDNEMVRRLAVNKISALRGKPVDGDIPSDDFEGGYLIEDRSEMDQQDVRRFKLPKVNLNARSYYTLVNLNRPEVGQPPAIKDWTDSEIEQIRTSPLRLNCPCHNQGVERLVKVVTDASSQVSGFNRRDGLVRQKLKSRKLMRKFNSKKDIATKIL